MSVMDGRHVAAHLSLGVHCWCGEMHSPEEAFELNDEVSYENMTDEEEDLSYLHLVERG